MKTLYALLVACALCTGLWAAPGYGQSRSSIPLEVDYVPSSPEVVAAMLKLADVKSSDVVYDLGCGDGRIVIAAAKERGARGVGIDIDPERIVEARRNAEAAGVADKVTFLQQDLFQSDFHDATVVMLFLKGNYNRKLKPRLFAQLKPGTPVVSHEHDMGDDWKPERTVYVGKSPVHLYRIPPAP